MASIRRTPSIDKATKRYLASHSHASRNEFRGQPTTDDIANQTMSEKMNEIKTKMAENAATPEGQAAIEKARKEQEIERAGRAVEAEYDTSNPIVMASVDIAKRTALMKWQMLKNKRQQESESSST